MSFGCKTTGIVYIFLLISIISVNAQNLYVFNKQTYLPVKNVVVYNDDKTKTSGTDELGIVDLSIFKNEGYINLQHPLYRNLRISLPDITRMRFRIGLEKKPDEEEKFNFENNRFPDNRKTPGKVVPIKQEDISFKNPSTAVDMLAMSNQVYIRKNLQGDGDPMIRGFSTNRLNYYLDGVKLNNAVFGNEQLSHLFMIDVNSVDQAEIIFGPGSSIYGNHALGGMVNFHLRTPHLSKSKSWTTTGNGFAKITSAEFEKTLHADINFSNNKWAFLAAISYSDFDDLKMGEHHNDYAKRPEYVTRINNEDSVIKNSDQNIQKFSAFNNFSFISKVKQQFTSNVDWTLSYYLTQTNSVPRYDKLIEYANDNLKYAENYIKPQQWMMSSLEINFSEPTKLYDHTKFIAAYQNYKEGINERIYKNAWLKKHTENVNMLSADLDFEKSLRWNNTFRYGINFCYNNVDSKGEQENIETGEIGWLNSRYADGSNKTIESGIYSTYQKMFDNLPVTISSGLRFSYLGLKSIFNDTTIYTAPGHVTSVQNFALKANAGITYHPDNWLLKLNLTSGFKAPDLDDAARIYSPEPGKVVVPNENLKPEYLYNVDLGIQYHFSNLFIVDFTAFFSHLDHAMMIHDFELDDRDSILFNGKMSKIQAMVNSGNAIVYGTSLNLEWQIFQQLLLTQSVTFIKSKNNEGLTVRDTPPIYGRSTLIFERNNLKMIVSACYNSTVTYNKLPATERARSYLYAKDDNNNPFTSSWWVIDFNVNYNFAENFVVSAEVDNILDYRYRPYSWGITAPGRNFKISFRYSL